MTFQKTAIAAVIATSILVAGSAVAAPATGLSLNAGAGTNAEAGLEWRGERFSVRGNYTGSSKKNLFSETDGTAGQVEIGDNPLEDGIHRIDGAVSAHAEANGKVNYTAEVIGGLRLIDNLELNAGARLSSYTTSASASVNANGAIESEYGPAGTSNIDYFNESDGVSGREKLKEWNAVVGATFLHNNVTASALYQPSGFEKGRVDLGAAYTFNNGLQVGGKYIKSKIREDLMATVGYRF